MIGYNRKTPPIRDVGGVHTGIGISIYRPSEKNGLLTHFWAPSWNSVEKFVEDYNKLLLQWGRMSEKRKTYEESKLTLIAE